MFQYRPVSPEAKANLDKRYYAPSRDVVYLGPELIKASVFMPHLVMSDKHLSSAIKFTDSNLDVESEKLLSVIRESIVDVVEKDRPLHEVFVEHGIEQVDPVAVLIFYTKLGQYFLASVCSGIKDMQTHEEAAKTLEEIIMECHSLLKDSWFHKIRRAFNRIRLAFIRGYKSCKKLCRMHT